MWGGHGQLQPPLRSHTRAAHTNINQRALFARVCYTHNPGRDLPPGSIGLPSALNPRCLGFVGFSQTPIGIYF